jgi:hypothetical protein
LKLSDLSISSIDCAVALSSSISNTRMPVPYKSLGRQADATAALETPLNN